MELAIAIVGWSVFGLVVLVSLGLNMVGLFGNWLILCALAGVWVAYGFVPFGWMGLVGFVGLAVLGEVLETALAGYGARKFGGSKGSMVAALIGCLLGAVAGTPLFPILGTLLGAFAGAFAGAAVYEYLKHDVGVERSLWVGTGAAVGKGGGIMAKFTCGLLMLAVAWVTWA